ncbi:helicase-related protein [Priestia aryabhattai]|uniref:RNA helicase n=1 Tax=Priestia aryabhattai TaxID=412384 RepID=A0AAX6NCJ0_PRIAR|nr:helicase-related protein [Priestia aryabhattai]MDU9693529.1 helicase-related protein [Priestia aryabhattai]
MSNKHQRKIEQSMREIEHLFNECKNAQGDEISKLEKEIRKHLEKIHNIQLTIKKLAPHLLTENVEKLNLIKKEFIVLSESLFKEITLKYPIKMTYAELINNKEHHLFRLGILGLINKEKLIESLFHNLFERQIPPHPKDEHPLARTISRKFIIHTGPTNSGKTFDSLLRLKESQNGMYLAPLRLLALEVFEKLNIEGTPCTLLTGDEEIQVPFSNHISCTVEKADLKNFYDLVVIDEAQLVSDSSRGNAWTRAILGLCAKEIHICCSLNAVPIVKRLVEDCGDVLEINTNERKTPLIMEKDNFEFPRDVRAGDALIVFSRKKVLQIASVLSQCNIKSSMIYGNLPPDTRRKQVALFASGENEVVVSTDAIGMGLNLPIKRVVLLETEKFDGNEERSLSDQEVKQILGRAGRKGLYPEGYVNSVKNKELIFEQLAKKDEKVREVYIGPLESTILSLRFGTLKEKLSYWKTFISEVPYIRKIEITQQLELLELLPKYLEENLTQEQIYRAIYIPFDYSNEELLLTWLRYLNEISKSNIEFEKPLFNLGSDLEGLETAYRKIDLYYSFSNSFNAVYDEQWITESRDLLSTQIHNVLREQTLKSVKLCSKCGEYLLIENETNLCTNCC